MHAARIGASSARCIVVVVVVAAAVVVVVGGGGVGVGVGCRMWRVHNANGFCWSTVRARLQAYSSKLAVFIIDDLEP